jgi:hypothetical protein
MKISCFFNIKNLYIRVAFISIMNSSSPKIKKMKKLFLTSGLVFCLGAGVMAQASGKAASKKANAPLKLSLTTTQTPQPESKADAEARLKAKQKHYEVLKAGAIPSTGNDPKVDAAKGSRKSSKN